MGKRNKDILREIREEGMFKEAEEISRRKVCYKVSSFKDGVLIVGSLFLAVEFFTFVNRFFDVM